MQYNEEFFIQTRERERERERPLLWTSLAVSYPFATTPHHREKQGYNPRSPLIYRKARCFAPLQSTSRLTPSSVMPASRTKCQKCGRCFQRLDTHHRVSATCRDVPPRSVPAATVTIPPPMNILSPPPSVNSNSAETLPQHSTRTASAVATHPHPQQLTREPIRQLRSVCPRQRRT